MREDGERQWAEQSLEQEYEEWQRDAAACSEYQSWLDQIVWPDTGEINESQQSN